MELFIKIAKNQKQ